ncbi:MAG: hypothetical protein OES32_09405 [Acidobacteriota bacterium]|nr:hypothetical protein [Acidobacteriota bacterium]MDH3523789.1 hypothetical protein [Acidobacteriota bacterium]
MNRPISRPRKDEPPSEPRPDDELLAMGLRLTPAQRLRWLEETVEELLPWLGLASRRP